MEFGRMLEDDREEMLEDNVVCEYCGGECTVGSGDAIEIDGVTFCCDDCVEGHYDISQKTNECHHCGYEISDGIEYDGDMFCDIECFVAYMGGEYV